VRGFTPGTGFAFHPHPALRATFSRKREKGRTEIPAFAGAGGGHGEGHSGKNATDLQMRIDRGPRRP